MATAIDAALLKFHTSLNVGDLSRSIDFYRALLGAEPAKVRENYAKFDLAEPPLVLSLIPGHPATGGNLNHAGLRVRTSEELVAIQRRLEASGYRTEREDGVECCYARQTKFWVTDPDKALWEVYVFHEDVAGSSDSMRTAATIRSLREDRPAAGSSTAGSSAAVASAAAAATGIPAAPAPAEWTHVLTAPLPDRIPAADASLDQVSLRGTINVSPATPHRATLLAELRRALKPGGTLTVHGLAGDRALDAPPKLAGPAAAVEFVPAIEAVLDELAATGFVEIAIGTLSKKAPFVVSGVPLREIRLTARTPLPASAAGPHRAVYLGPLAQVTDDFGNVFRRGAITAIPARDWELLAAGPAREAFLFLGPAQATIPLATAGCCTA